MKNSKWFTVLLFLGFVFFFGCSTDSELPAEQIEEVNASARSEMKFNFTTSLKGDNEVPPVETSAKGVAIVRISKDQSYLEYKLIVSNIDNVVASHFHMAPAGANGPVVAFLYSADSPTGNYNGVLAEGVITAEEVIGSIAGDFDALVEAIRAGNIYINIHSTDVPSGELRGQL